MRVWGAYLLVSVVVILGPVLVVGCGDSAGDEPATGSSARDDALVKRLHRGGNVLLLRNVATDKADSSPGFDDCTRVRYLTDAGRREANTIRRAMRELQIPVGSMLTSPLCHAVETGAEVVSAGGLASRSLLPPKLLQRILKESDPLDYSLTGQLRNYVDSGSNVVFVSHESAIATAGGLTLREGETAIVAPADDERGYRIVERLMPADWTRLASR